MEQARQNLETQVLDRAGKDPEFREQLKHDPLGTVSRDFGVQVPPDITVEVVEETPTKVYLVLPSAPTQPGQVLADLELESVAGGWSAMTAECGTCTVQMSCEVWPTCQQGCGG